MGWSKADKETISQVVTIAVTKAVEPLIKDIQRLDMNSQKHSITLFGPEEAPDGLVTEVAALKDDRDKSKARMWKLVGITGGVAIVASYVIPLLIRIVFTVKP